MGSFVRRVVPAVALGVAACLAPALASASEQDDGATRRFRPRYQALDLQAVAIAELLPNYGVGFDGAYVVGNETFHARLGAMIAGVRGFRIGSGTVANLIEVGQADLCAAKNVFQHRVRMCLGGQAGIWQHFWKGIDTPKKRWSPWVAGTLKADYTYALTKRWGLLFGVGVAVPAIGPSFRGHDDLGRPSPVVIPGPVSGNLSFGTVIRFI